MISVFSSDIHLLINIYLILAFFYDYYYFLYLLEDLKYT